MQLQILYKVNKKWDARTMMQCDAELLICYNRHVGLYLISISNIFNLLQNKDCNNSIEKQIKTQQNKSHYSQSKGNVNIRRIQKRAVPPSWALQWDSLNRMALPIHFTEKLFVRKCDHRPPTIESSFNYYFLDTENITPRVEDVF